VFDIGWHLVAQILYFIGAALVFLSLIFAHLQFCCRRERAAAFRTLSGVLLLSCEFIRMRCKDFGIISQNIVLTWLTSDSIVGIDSINVSKLRLCTDK